MSVTMPTKITWQSGGGNDPSIPTEALSQQPVAGKIVQGWTFEEQPSAWEWNWLKNNANDWEDYVQRHALRTACRVVTANPIDPAAAGRANPSATEYVTDGTADEVQINAALASLPVPGGAVYLSEGRFNCAAAIVIPSGCSLIGQGVGKTLIQASADGNFALIDGTAGGLAFVTIKDLEIDGDKAARTGNYQGINIDASDDILIENVYVHDIADIAAATAHGITVTGASNRVRVVKCRVEDCATRGISVGGTGDFWVDKCLSRSNGSWNISVDAGASYVTDCRTFEAATDGEIRYVGDGRVSGCNAFALAGGGTVGIQLTTSSDNCHVVGCTIAEPDLYGIEVPAGADHVSISNNYITGSELSAIYVAGDNCTIEGNTIEDTDVAGHGIEVVGTHNALTGNVIRLAAVSGIYVAATGLHTCITGGTIEGPDGEGIDIIAGAVWTTITGVVIDMTGTTAGDGIECHAADVEITGCTIKDDGAPATMEYGIFTDGARTSISGGKINNSLLDGLSIAAGSDDTDVDTIHISNATVDGISVVSDRVQIVGVRIRSAAVQGIHVSGALDLQIASCWIYQSGINGILIDGVSDDFLISNCKFKNNNTTTTAANTSDIYVTQPSDGGIITGCRMTNLGGGAQVVNGIFLDNGAPGVTNIYVHGNMIQIGSGASIADAGGLGIGQSGGAVIPNVPGVEANEVH